MADTKVIFSAQDNTKKAFGTILTNLEEFNKKCKQTEKDLNTVKKAVENATKAFRAIGKVVKLVSNVLTSALSFITNLVKSALKAIKNVISGLFKWIKTALSTLLKWITSALKTVYNLAKNVAKKAFNALQNLATSIANKIKSIFSTAIKTVIASVIAMLAAIGTAIKNYSDKEEIKLQLKVKLGNNYDSIMKDYKRILEYTTASSESVLDLINDLIAAGVKDIYKYGKAIVGVARLSGEQIKTVKEKILGGTGVATDFKKWGIEAQGLSDKFVDIDKVLSNINDRLEAVSKNSLSQTFSNIKNDLSTIWETIGRIFSQPVKEIAQAIREVTKALSESEFKKLSEGVNSIWSDIKEKVLKVFEAIKYFIKYPELWKQFKDSIKKNIGTIFDALKNKLIKDITYVAGFTKSILGQAVELAFSGLQKESFWTKVTAALGRAFGTVTNVLTITDVDLTGIDLEDILDEAGNKTGKYKLKKQIFGYTNLVAQKNSDGTYDIYSPDGMLLGSVQTDVNGIINGFKASATTQVDLTSLKKDSEGNYVIDTPIYGYVNGIIYDPDENTLVDANTKKPIKDLTVTKQDGTIYIKPSNNSKYVINSGSVEVSLNVKDVLENWWSGSGSGNGAKKSVIEWWNSKVNKDFKDITLPFGANLSISQDDEWYSVLCTILEAELLKLGRWVGNKSFWSTIGETIKNSFTNVAGKLTVKDFEIFGKTYSADSNGKVVLKDVLNANGVVTFTTETYEENGKRLIRVRDSNGKVVSEAEANGIVKFESEGIPYNVTISGSAIFTTDTVVKNGKSYVQVYDENGNVVSEAENLSGSAKFTAETYTKNGKTYVKIFNDKGNVISDAPSLTGKAAFVAETVIKDGKTYAIVRDSQGNLISEVESLNGAADFITETYSKNGKNYIRVKDANGNVVSDVEADGTVNITQMITPKTVVDSWGNDIKSKVADVWNSKILPGLKLPETADFQLSEEDSWWKTFKKMISGLWSSPEFKGLFETISNWWTTKAVPTMTAFVKFAGNAIGVAINNAIANSEALRTILNKVPGFNFTDVGTYSQNQEIAFNKIKQFLPSELQAVGPSLLTKEFLNETAYAYNEDGKKVNIGQTWDRYLRVSAKGRGLVLNDEELIDSLNFIGKYTPMNVEEYTPYSYYRSEEQAKQLYPKEFPTLYQALNNSIEDIRDFISSWNSGGYNRTTQKHLATVYPELTEYIGKEIPMFAKGGVVDKPTIALIGEAGPEIVVPLNEIPKYGKGTENWQSYVDTDNDSRLIKLIEAYGNKLDESTQLINDSQALIKMTATALKNSNETAELVAEVAIESVDAAKQAIKIANDATKTAQNAVIAANEAVITANDAAKKVSLPEGIDVSKARAEAEAAVSQNIDNGTIKNTESTSGRFFSTLNDIISAGKELDAKNKKTEEENTAYQFSSSIYKLIEWGKSAWDDISGKTKYAVYAKDEKGNVVNDSNGNPVVKSNDNWWKKTFANPISDLLLTIKNTWKTFVKDGLWPAFDKVGTKLDDILTKAGQTISKFAKYTIKTLSDTGAFGENIGGIVSSLFEGITSGEIKSFWDAIGVLAKEILPWFQKGFEKIGTLFDEAFEIFGEAISAMAEGIGEMLVPILKDLIPFLKVLAGIITALTPVVQSTLAPLIMLICVILRALTTILDKLMPVFAGLSAVIQWVSDAITWVIGSFLNWISKLNIFGWRPLKFLGGNKVSAPRSISDYYNDIMDTYNEAKNSTTTIGETSSAGVSSQTASYTGASTIHIYNYFDGSYIVGSGGMRELAIMIKNEFENLSYSGQSV